MSIQLLSTECAVSPTQVWARLAADLQQRTIRLMVQLAFNLVIAQTEAPRVEPKESDHASLSCPPQNPA